MGDKINKPTFTHTINRIGRKTKLFPTVLLSHPTSPTTNNKYMMNWEIDC